MQDLISRQAAIDALWKALYEYEDKTEKQFVESDDLDIEEWILHRIFVQDMSDIDRKAILDLPSAQPERKKGEWINRSLNIVYPVWERYTCSVCGKHSYSYDFCPNCGAKMDEEGKDD